MGHDALRVNTVQSYTNPISCVKTWRWGSTTIQFSSFFYGHFLVPEQTHLRFYKQSCVIFRNIINEPGQDFLPCGFLAIWCLYLKAQEETGHMLIFVCSASKVTVTTLHCAHFVTSIPQICMYPFVLL